MFTVTQQPEMVDLKFLYRVSIAVQSFCYVQLLVLSVHGKVCPEVSGEPLFSEPIYLFPSGFSVENLIPRTSGHILVTVSNEPKIFQIDPRANNTANVVHSFVDSISLFGIAETETDLFYVLAGNFSGSPTEVGTPGTWTLWQVDLRATDDPSRTDSAAISRAAGIEGATLLDGLAALTPHLFVSGDPQEGVLYLIDVQSETSRAIMQDELFVGMNTSAAAGLAHIGINGLKFRDEALYFTNSAKQILGKISIDARTGDVTGPAIQVFNYSTSLDDFNFDTAGNFFLTWTTQGIAVRPRCADPDSNHTRLVTPLYGANSCAFGRDSQDANILYATQDSDPPRVISIDTSSLGLCEAQVEDRL